MSNVMFNLFLKIFYEPFIFGLNVFSSYPTPYVFVYIIRLIDAISGLYFLLNILDKEGNTVYSVSERVLLF